MQLKKPTKAKVDLPEYESASEISVQKIKTDRLMKVGRIALWAVILFLLLRGIASIVSPGSEARIARTVSDYQEDAYLREQVQVEASAFAEGFVQEYYTFTGKMNSDYEQRLGRYFAKNVEVKAPVAGKVSAQLRQVNATRIHYLSKKEFDVDVHAVVEYIPLTEENVNVTKDLYLRIPVSVDKKGQYAVVSLPTYIPAQKTGNAEPVKSYIGDQVQNEQIQKIKDTLNSFFMAYYGGSDTEVSYYLASGSNIKAGIGGAVDYQKIDYISVYREGTEDYLVDVTITVADELQPMQQRLFMRLQQVKSRYYIKSITTRAL